MTVDSLIGTVATGQKSKGSRGLAAITAAIALAFVSGLVVAVAMPLSDVHRVAAIEQEGRITFTLPPALAVSGARAQYEVELGVWCRDRQIGRRRQFTIRPNLPLQATTLRRSSCPQPTPLTVTLKRTASIWTLFRANMGLRR